MKTSLGLAKFMALSLALNVGSSIALRAAEPVKTVEAVKPVGPKDDTNDGACGCDDDEGASPSTAVTTTATGTTPTVSTTVDTTVATPDKPTTKKKAKVKVSTSTYTTGNGDGKTMKETTRAKYVNGELVSGSTTRTSGNEAANMSRPIDTTIAPQAPAASILAIESAPDAASTTAVK